MLPKPQLNNGLQVRYLKPRWKVPSMLIGFEDPEVWWEEMLLRDPRFQERVAQARCSLRNGQGISIETLRAKHDIGAPPTSPVE